MILYGPPGTGKTYNSVIYAQNYVRYRWMKPSVFAVYYSYMLKCIRSHGYNYVRMLDIGCGTGQFTVRLAEAFTRDGIHYHIDAVDTSTEGLHILESLIAQKRLTRINLMKAFKEDSDTPIMHAKKVAVVGGGNVAMDAARTALRLGAEVHIVYRRSEEELPARKEEVHHAKEEGIIFDLLTNPTEIIADENGWVSGIKCIRMELGEPDAYGRRRPVEIPGSEFVMDVDCVIMSLGTSPNPLISSTTSGLDINNRKCIIADEEHGKTTKEAVYAGGDAVTGAATVILAMGAGKAAAKGIHEYLSNK